MQWYIWYDLAVLELSELGDPVKGKLVEAQKTQGPTLPDLEEPPDESEESA